MVSMATVSAGAVDGEGETLGGFGSALELAGNGRELVALADRGAGDGTIEFRPRVHFFKLEREGTALDLQLERTLVLTDATGRAFTGLLPEAPAAAPPQRADGQLCLDPEGLALRSDGTLFVSEEYAPAILEFSPDGRLVRRLETPSECRPTGKDGVDQVTDERKDLRSGREPNRGFEGLTLLPDGKLAAILQSGLAQDGGRNAGFTRLYVFDPATGKAVAAYRVPFADLGELESTAPDGKAFEPKHLSFNALASLPDGRLLALERDNFGEDGSNKFHPSRWKAVVILDLSGAENILGREAGDARPVQRAVLFNLAALAIPGGDRERLGAKWESIAVEGVGAGRVRLLMGSDNDFLTPKLAMRDAGGQPVTTDFPRAERAQDTMIVEIEADLPPAAAPFPRDDTTQPAS